MTKRPILSMIMPTYNRGEVFEQSKVAVLKAIEGMDIEFIVVNDSKTSDILLNDSEKDKIILVNNPKQGVASARNFGVTHASSDNLLFIDDDIIIHKENITQLIKCLSTVSLDNACINVNWVYPPKLHLTLGQNPFGRFLIKYGFTTMKGWANFAGWNDNQIFEIPNLASYFLLISKRKFEKAGKYDEDFPHAGFEDEDFSNRATKEIKVFCDPLNTVWHNEVDRVEIKAWMARKERGSITRKIGVLKGGIENKIEYNWLKGTGYKFLVKIQPLLLFILTHFPNIKYLDFLYFKLVKICLGTTIYKGYNSVK